MDRELLQDSDGLNESFWDGLGVEFEAKYIFDFRRAPRGPGSARDGGAHFLYLYCYEFVKPSQQSYEKVMLTSC